MTLKLSIRPYQFDFMLLGQKWLKKEVGRSEIKMIVTKTTKSKLLLGMYIPSSNLLFCGYEVIMVKCMV